MKIILIIAQLIAGTTLLCISAPSLLQSILGVLLIFMSAFEIIMYCFGEFDDNKYD